jgi:hypothetical protein
MPVLGLRSTVLWVAVVVAGWAMIAIPAYATYYERTTADEPQYLLSALSLAEDHNLSIDDELAAERYRPFHEVDLPVQTETLANGHAVSPHDPLLPALLAVPMGLGGWVAAKATMALLAGVLAGLLTWVAHRRFGVPLGVAALTTVAFGVAAPLSAYGSQIYPELPAALAVTVAIALLAAPRTQAVGLAAAVTALPWLGVKYAPVAVVLAGLGVFRLWRARRPRAAFATVVGLGLAGAGYLVVHRLLYGGWTVYAAGDHFSGGELTVVGTEPNYLGRSRRVVGLLLDHGFGLAAWMPAYLLIVPALAALVRRRPPGWLALVLPAAAGWATATWVALTMHGWWSPGRQTVVILPCLVLAVAWWAGRIVAARWFVAVSGMFGAITWLWLAVEATRRRHTLITDFEATGNPLYQAWRTVLPDYRHPGLEDWMLQAGWLVALGVVAVWAVTERPLPQFVPFKRRRPSHVRA